MADAKRTIITQEIKTIEKVSAFSLTMTIDEAEALTAILVKVAGSMTNSPRKHTNAVLMSLEKAHVRDWEAPGHPFSLLASRAGGLEFKDFRPEPKPFHGVTF
ncbi:hypothetical protein [Streptomyces antarcticus]|uniref:hypothetical protein n=1 Tax=Streptomyces antarcticus TaxID=2996458 RepID=UPI002271CE1B|nr:MULTISPECIES: hypothetical protein [unclassified Streptomyces]MCY0941894.1 hypothetical protein [Streptomyces sp. H34-AA3]MCZ4082833.1 hypothetical protein [Streptomyces sp. H34-S5]